MRMNLSLPAVTTVVPSGANATVHTSAVCPLNRHRSLPLSASQTAAVLSALAVASSLPFGEKASEKMSFWCPLRSEVPAARGSAGTRRSEAEQAREANSDVYVMVGDLAMVEVGARGSIGKRRARSGREEMMDA